MNALSILPEHVFTTHILPLEGVASAISPTCDYYHKLTANQLLLQKEDVKRRAIDFVREEIEQYGNYELKKWEEFLSDLSKDTTKVHKCSNPTRCAEGQAMNSNLQIFGGNRPKGETQLVLLSHNTDYPEVRLLLICDYDFNVVKWLRHGVGCPQGKKQHIVYYDKKNQLFFDNWLSCVGPLRREWTRAIIFHIRF